MFRLYNTPAGVHLERDGEGRATRLSIDELFRADDPLALVHQAWESSSAGALPDELLAPLGSQEVWAAGVTYYRSRTARMEESEEAGGDRFYDLVYDAERPELFLKATSRRVRRPERQLAFALIPPGMCPNPSSPSPSIAAAGSSGQPSEMT